MAERKTADRDADATVERDKPAVDAAIADSVEQVQETVDAENAQGFRGLNPDVTPNHHYTFMGAAKGLPTPETDPHLAAKVGRPFLHHAGHTLPNPVERGDAKKDEK